MNRQTNLPRIQQEMCYKQENGCLGSPSPITNCQSGILAPRGLPHSHVVGGSAFGQKISGVKTSSPNDSSSSIFSEEVGFFSVADTFNDGGG